MSTTERPPVARLEHPVSLAEFYRDYYLTRTPVVISTQALDQLGWQTGRWTNEYLLYKAGAQEVLVLRRDDTSNFAPEHTRYTPMRFHEFMTRVMMRPQGDHDLYLNLQHDKVMEPPLLQLLGDFNVPVYFKDLALRCVNLWMGNSESSITTPLHHDFNDNLYVVVEGRKHFTLFPPEQAPNLYPQGKLLEVGANGYIRYESLDNKPHMSLLDLSDPDVERFPLYAQAAETRQECSVEKNEMLFLPTGWFHQVTSVGRHIAVSFFSIPPSVDEMEWMKRAISDRQGREVMR
ncbi:MAG TPA: cupin-like domain-containing protein [Gammaproteobacteria bacterium]|nr:cupin-like domain-containing protein [Gammaproteobacteria bacterium]